MHRLRSFLGWLDKNLLLILSVFLLAFIPLFPKIPLFDILPGYIVRARPEDFLVSLTALVWLRDAWKKRIQWNTSYFWFVCLYGAAGLVSILLGVFLLNTVPFQLLHIGKTGLNWARYLEYFTLFFFLFSALRAKKHVYIALVVIVLTLLGVVAYGVGQEFAHLPVYSTMNREFSKGVTLYLESGARPQSTFAGHYDLAAYLVIILPLIFALSLGGIKTKSKLADIGIFLSLQTSHLVGLIMLILTGSKTSIVGYVLGMGIVILLTILRLPTKKQRFLWGGLVMGLSIFGAVIGWIVLPSSLKAKVTNAISKIQTPSDRPIDLVGSGYQPKIVTTVMPDGSVRTTTVMQKETWSENALKYGLSMGIRLDTLWPDALLGLARNPLTGASYGTLTSLDSHAFVEADSTDNNFLRTLGETGVLGFVIFYGLVVFVFWQAFKLVKSRDPLSSKLAIGLCGSTVGLLLSAFYLDVFASSKVAFTFWAVSALVLKGNQIFTTRDNTQFLLIPIKRLLAHFQKHWPIYVVVVVSFFLLHQNPFMDHNQTKNIEGATSALEQLTRARCFISRGTLGLCRNNGLTRGFSPTLYALLLIPFLKLLSTLGAFYYLNMLLIFAALLLTYLYFRSKVKSVTIFLGLLIPVNVAFVIHAAQMPMTNLVFILIVIGFPLLAFGYIKLSLKLKSKAKDLRMLNLGIIFLFSLTALYSVFSHDLLLRFRNIAPTPAFDAVELDNGNVIPTPGKRAYLITAMNPYFSDLYNNGYYTLLPLSRRQPYAMTSTKTWGVPDAANLPKLYTSLLSNNHVYLSDFGIGKNQDLINRFNDVKSKFDVNYVALGCNETCNVYALQPATPNISPNPASPFGGKPLMVNNLPPAYQFAVVNQRFDLKLSSTAFGTDTEGFITKLGAVKNQAEQFAVISGDFIPNIDPYHANSFLSGFIAKTSFPILYTPGNNDLFSKKYYDTGLQFFYTNHEFFVLMNPDGKSHIDNDQQLALYDAFLRLEKLLDIKTIFIIGSDLNWQDHTDSLNAINLVEKKLSAFPHLHTFIVTQNHDPKVTASGNWFAEKQSESKSITYVASLSAGTIHDQFIQFSVDPHGNVNLHPQALLAP